MLTTEYIVNMSLLGLLDCVALALNAIFIFAILTRTPESLRTYSVLLLNTAVCDSAAAIFSLACAMRFVHVNGAIVFVFDGPCILVGDRFCHATHSIYLGLMSYSFILLLISFSYRLYLMPKELGSNTHAITRAHLLAIGMASAAPCCIMAMSMYKSASFAVPSIEAVLPDQVYSVLDVLGESPLPRYSVALFACFFNSCLGATAVARYRLMHRIKILDKGADRSRHQMIFNCLTAQALLPLSSVIGVACWLIDMLIIASPYLQHAAHLTSSVFALGSPIISLTFLRPYRRYVMSLWNNSKVGIEDSHYDETKTRQRVTSM